MCSVKPRVLIGCEFSGAVRREFRLRGFDAWSCDLLAADDGSPFHLQCDVRERLHDGWDLGIFHPMCRFLANSSNKHLYIGKRKENGRDPDRWRLMEEAAAFFLELWRAPIPCIAIENPVMHGHGAAIIGTRQTQTIQPWQFGHTEKKRTCLWLKNLPKLVETNNVYAEMMNLPRKDRERVHFASPGPDRWKRRSITLPGIAEAFADQWGTYIRKQLQEAA